jgi:hypothetical protein
MTAKFLYRFATKNTPISEQSYSDGFREVLSVLGHFSDHKKIWAEFLVGPENAQAKFKSLTRDPNPIAEPNR